MIRRKIKKIFQTIIFSTFFFVQSSYGATQGSLGTTSAGGVNIDIALGDAARISDIADSTFGAWDGTGNETNNDDICVYSNTAGGAYNVTATGDGPSSSFQVADGSGNFITYQFRWNDVSGTNSGGVNLTSGTILTGQTGADTVSVDCSGGSALNARIRIRFTEANLSVAIGNSYTGNVTISISPE